MKKTYVINPKNAGLVIGRKGEGIRALERIPHVQRIIFDTKSNPAVYKLTVSASSIDACNAVDCEIRKRIKDNETSKHVGNDIIYIDEDDSSLTRIALKPISESNDVVYRTIECYSKISKIERSEEDLADALDGLRIARNVKSGKNKGTGLFFEFSKETFISSINRELRRNNGNNFNLEFTASPGKLAFRSIVENHNRHLCRTKLVQQGLSYLKELNLKQRFSPNLSIDLKDKVFQKLAENGFKQLNEEPEAFTIVHLFSGEDKEFFSVQLADIIDDNLRSAPQNDMRLTKEKKVICDIGIRSSLMQIKMLKYTISLYYIAICVPGCRML